MTTVANASDRSRIRVLVVDDESASRESLSMCLEFDFSVASCSGAAEAERELERREYEVLVADYAMPGTSGTELLRRARAKHPMTVGILVTGHADLPEVQRARKNEDIYLVLLKPFDPRELLRWVSMAGRTARLKRANDSLGSAVKRS